MSEADLKRAMLLRDAIADAESFRMLIAGRTDDSAYYWRTRLATDIYAMRRELIALTTGAK